MSKYHINSKGEPGICKATKRTCRFGDKDTEHYNSAKEAQIAYELKNTKKVFGEVIRKIKRSPDTNVKLPESFALNNNDSKDKISLIIKNAGAQNVFPGSINKSLRVSKKDYRRMQEKVNQLEWIQESEETSFGRFCNVEKIEKETGFKYLGVGSYRTAFLDPETNKVYKITHLDTSRGIAEKVFDCEQHSYALLDKSFFDKDSEFQYVETMFFTAENGSPVIVQDYCNFNKPWNSQMEKVYARDLEKIDGIYDVDSSNVRINECGQVILFDCLDPYLKF